MNRIDVISLDPGERREWNGGNSTSQRGVKFPVDNESKVWYHLPFFFEKEIVLLIKQRISRATLIGSCNQESANLKKKTSA